MRIELRTLPIREDGCFSVMLAHEHDGQPPRPFAVTVERTFENLRTVIGNGTFRCRKSFYHHGGYPTFEILVPGHDRVLFHKGNKETDSMACVIVAESFGQLGDQAAVLDSKGGFNEFFELVKDLDWFDLIVTGEMRRTA